jgi:hypothetical protein
MFGVYFFQVNSITGVNLIAKRGIIVSFLVILAQKENIFDLLIQIASFSFMHCGGGFHGGGGGFHGGGGRFGGFRHGGFGGGYMHSHYGFGYGPGCVWYQWRVSNFLVLFDRPFSRE